MDLSQEDMRLTLVKGETLSTPALIQPYSSQTKTQMSRIYAQEPQQGLIPQQQWGALKTLGVPMLLSSLLYSFVGTSSFSERSVPSTKVYDVASQKYEYRLTEKTGDCRKDGRKATKPQKGNCPFRTVLSTSRTL